MLSMQIHRFRSSVDLIAIELPDPLASFPPHRPSPDRASCAALAVYLVFRRLAVPAIRSDFVGFGLATMIHEAIKRSALKSAPTGAEAYIKPWFPVFSSYFQPAHGKFWPMLFRKLEWRFRDHLLPRPIKLNVFVKDGDQRVCGGRGETGRLAKQRILKGCM